MKESSKMIRIGKISSLNVERMRARVTFSDKNSSVGDLVSAELSILTSGAGFNKHYFNYRVGESVVCCYPSNDEDGEGYIIGSFNTDESEMKANDVNIIRLDLGNHGLIEYNEENGDLLIEFKGNIKIKADKNIEIESSEAINITASKDITEKGKNIRLN